MHHACDLPLNSSRASDWGISWVSEGGAGVRFAGVLVVHWRVSLRKKRQQQPNSTDWWIWLLYHRLWVGSVNVNVLPAFRAAVFRHFSASGAMIWPTGSTQPRGW